MKEKIKRGIKKAVLGSLIMLYSFKANQHTKQSSKYREEEKGYRKTLKEITRDKSSAELKSDFQKLKSEYKKLGKQLILDYLIAINYAKANRHEKKSIEYGNKKREYATRLEEISKYKSAPESTGENKLESIIKEDPKTPDLETKVYKDYHASMEEFYKRYEAANDHLTGTIGRILAGDYVEDGKIIWYWKDRVKKVEDYARRGSLSEDAQKEIFAILKSNEYFMKNKREELSQLNNLIFSGIKKEIGAYLKNS